MQHRALQAGVEGSPIVDRTLEGWIILFWLAYVKEKNAVSAYCSTVRPLIINVKTEACSSRF